MKQGGRNQAAWCVWKGVAVDSKKTKKISSRTSWELQKHTSLGYCGKLMLTRLQFLHPIPQKGYIYLSTCRMMPNKI